MQATCLVLSAQCLIWFCMQLPIMHQISISNAYFKLTNNCLMNDIASNCILIFCVVVVVFSVFALIAFSLNSTEKVVVLLLNQYYCIRIVYVKFNLILRQPSHKHDSSPLRLPATNHILIRWQFPLWSPFQWFIGTKLYSNPRIFDWM